MVRANGGGSSPSVYHKNTKDLVQDLINAEDNPAGSGLTFRNKIKAQYNAGLFALDKDFKREFLK